MHRPEGHIPARRALLAQAARAAALALALPPALARATDTASASAPAPAPVPALFSTRRPGDSPPQPWTMQALRGIPPNAHALVEDAGITVLEIRSSASGSSLLHPLDGDAAQARSLRWRWKTDGQAPLANASATRPETTTPPGST